MPVTESFPAMGPLPSLRLTGPRLSAGDTNLGAGPSTDTLIVPGTSIDRQRNWVAFAAAVLAIGQVLLGNVMRANPPIS